jgi:hypothetical protein
MAECDDFESVYRRARSQNYAERCQKQAEWAA